MNQYYTGMVKVAGDGQVARDQAVIPHLGTDDLHEHNQYHHEKWKEAHVEIQRQLAEAVNEGGDVESLSHLEAVAAHHVESHGALHAAMDHVASGGSLEALPVRTRNMALWGLKHLGRA